MTSVYTAYTKYKSKPLESRRSEYEKIRTRYPDKVAILITTMLGDGFLAVKTDTPPRIKYLVSNDMTLAQFMSIVRARTSCLTSEMTLFMAIHGEIPPMTRLVGEQQCYADDDGFVTVVFMTENTFGDSKNTSLIRHR
jgi:hypothetical protein